MMCCRKASALMLGMLFTVQCLAAGVDVDRNEITISMGNEPPSLDSSEIADGTSAFIMGHIMEGLTVMDRRQRAAPGVAESWQMEGNTLTFRLREAKWSDGKPVSAADFVHAWRLAVSPETSSPFSTQFYDIVNARQVLAGELPPEKLGVSARDDRTLVVQLTQPVVYFPQLVSGANFLPIRQDVYESKGELYASEPEHLVSNGPFRLTRWMHGAALRLEKNPQYWNTDRVRLEAINIDYITPDLATVLNLFRDNQVAFAPLDNVTVQTASESGLRIRHFPTSATQLVILNVKEGRPTANVHLRRALAAALDKQEIVNRVLAMPGNAVTHSVYAAWMPTIREGFAESGGLGNDPLNMDEAREHMRAAKEALGEVDSLTLLTVTSGNTLKLSEYLQGVYKRELDLDIKIDSQNMKQWLAKAFGADFDITVISYGPLYGDPSDPAGLWTSNSDANLAGFNSQEYDQLFETLRTSDDPQLRKKSLSRMQQILESEVPVIPLFDNSAVYVQDARLKGVYRGRLGISPGFTDARIQR